MKYHDNEIYLERIYNAPVNLVWDVWNDKNEISHWWGPRGFTITTKNKDVKTGGSWDYIMHGPDGKDWPNFTEYLEIVPYKKMVYDHGGGNGQKPMFRVTVNFSEIAKNKTKIEMWMALPSQEAAIATKSYIKQANGDTCWDRLAEHLELIQNKKDVFVMNRTFRASIEKMYDVWSNPSHLQKWLAPNGASMKFYEANIQTGGSSFYEMGSGDKMMYGKTAYIELIKPNLIIYVQNFCDKNGNLSKHPMAPVWPSYLRATVNFESESINETRVTITWEIEGEASLEEKAVFNSAKMGMTMGWSGAFEQLENYLKF